MIQGLLNPENGMMNGFSDIGMWHFYTEDGNYREERKQAGFRPRERLVGD